MDPVKFVKATFGSPFDIARFEESGKKQTEWLFLNKQELLFQFADYIKSKKKRVLNQHLMHFKNLKVIPQSFQALVKGK